jgi:hypothetical protein
MFFLKHVNVLQHMIFFAEISSLLSWHSLIYRNAQFGQKIQIGYKHNLH